MRDRVSVSIATNNIDIRYVLWVIDKVGGASNIVKELVLRK